MTEAYRQGFMAKCAEQGVDPGQLLKVANPFLNRAWKTVGRHGSRFWELLSGSGVRNMSKEVKNLRGLRARYANMANSGAAGAFKQQYNDTADAIGKSIRGKLSAIDAEKSNILMTRLGLGTGIFGGGALAAGLSGGNDRYYA